MRLMAQHVTDPNAHKGAEMRIRLTQTIRHREAGSEHDVSDRVAKRLVQKGLAERADVKKATKRKPAPAPDEELTVQHDPTLNAETE